MSKDGDDFVDQLIDDMLDDDEKVTKAKPTTTTEGPSEGNRNIYANREGHIAGLKNDPDRKEEVKREVIAAGLPEAEANYTVERAYAQGVPKHVPSKPKAQPKPQPSSGNTKFLFAEKGTQDDSKRLPEVARFLGTRGHVTLIAGLGGVGKTTLLLYAAHCIATGTKFLNGKVQKGKAVIITNEDKRVIKEMMSELPNCDDIHIHDGSPDIIAHLKAVSVDDGVSMIIIDPAMVAHRWFGVRDWSENASNPWGEFIDGCLKPLARQANALVVLLHHCRKRPSQGGVTARDFIRGSGSIVDMVDNAGVLVAEGSDRTLELVKRRGGRRQDKLRIELALREITQTHETGETETFHAVTSGKLAERGLPLDELINFRGDKSMDGETILREVCAKMHEHSHKYTMGYIPKGEILRFFSSSQRGVVSPVLGSLLYNNSNRNDDDRLFSFQRKGKAATYTLRNGPEGPCPNGVITDISKHVTE